MKKIHRAFRPEGAPFSASIPLCSSYHTGFRVTDDPTKVTCQRCRKIQDEAEAFRAAQQPTIRGITTDDNGKVTRWSVGQSREEAQALVDAVGRMREAIAHPSTPRQLRVDLATVLSALEG